MANQEQLEILKSGVENWNRWREENPREKIDFIPNYIGGAFLRGYNLRGADLRKANLHNANLVYANLYQANLSEANLIGANLGHAKLNEADLNNADLHRATLDNANLSFANLHGAYLDEAKLYYTKLHTANLNWANLRKAILNKADLTNTDLSNADFSGADLSGADLGGAKLNGVNFSYANLSGVNLNKAYLIRCPLIESNLSDANLSSANLSGANLSRANLQQTDLNNANLNLASLRRANLTRTLLTNTNLNEVYFYNTIFSEVELSNVNGLENCNHEGNSHIDYHTLKISKNLPVNFLRGCGLSDEYIKAIPSLFEQPQQFYYCFISYSTKDQEFAERLFSDLQNRGIRAWFAPHDIKAGQKIIDQIEKGIQVTDKLLLILSEDSIGSDWVKTEINKAQKKSKQISKQVLFPISITKYDRLKEWEFYLEGKDMSQEIRDYYLLDFENWKDHDDYKKNFERLVESLRVEAEG